MSASTGSRADQEPGRVGRPLCMNRNRRNVLAHEPATPIGDRKDPEGEAALMIQGPILLGCQHQFEEAIRGDLAHRLLALLIQVRETERKMFLQPGKIWLGE